MFENDAKGWYGSYSIAGRESAEKYHIVTHKDEIIQNEHKKLKIRDLFTPDEPEQVETLDDKFDIFKSYSSEKNNIINQLFSPKQVKKKKKIHNDKFKYHNIHMKDENRKKKKPEPASTTYNPKYEYIWPKLITGPSWKKTKGRTYKKKEIDNKEFLNNTNFSPSSKCLVNMNKSTQRGDFNLSNNIRIRNDKGFDGSLSERIIKKKKNKTIKNLKLTNSKIKSLNELDFEKINISNYNELSSRRNNSTFYSKREISVPDFQKTLSREQREKPKVIKANNIPFILPNYSLVRERTLTMTLYEKPKKFIPRIKIMQGFDSEITFNKDKVINKIHSQIKTPNFKLMTSRNNKNNSKLPTYMQNIHDRKSVESMTEKSLQLNSYYNGKLMSPSNSFFPKKSFNNIINLHLLNYENLNGKDGLSDYQKEHLKTISNFYHKNYDELIKEGGLNKFDNITFKTIEQRKRIDPSDMEKFLLNFDNTDV